MNNEIGVKMQFLDLTNAVNEDLSNRGAGSIRENVFLNELGFSLSFVIYSGPYPVEYVDVCYSNELIKNDLLEGQNEILKMIAKSSLLKFKYPSANFIAYFSDKPLTQSNSAKLIDSALCYKIFNEVRFIKKNKDN